MTLSDHERKAFEELAARASRGRSMVGRKRPYDALLVAVGTVSLVSTFTWSTPLGLGSAGVIGLGLWLGVRRRRA